MEDIELYLIGIFMFVLLILIWNTIKYYKGEKRKIKNLHRFANEGESNAQKHLAKHYEDGNMVKKDTKKAAFWYQRAAFSDKNRK
ncbi:MAG: SEL1-like repeat protein [Sulfurovum sp.]|nr:SEL1-like repeat protein [Sulfurovum sp.]